MNKKASKKPVENNKKASNKPTEKPRKSRNQRAKNNKATKKKATPSSKKSARRPPPFAGAVGSWVKRSEFDGLKGFGIFKCYRCAASRTWASAHAHRDFHQACKKCNKECLPKRLWKTHVPRINKGVVHRKRPHDSSRCEACKLGVCSGI